MASTYLSRTFGTPTNASKFTYSAWVKRSALGASYILLYANGGNSQNFSNIMFNSSDSFFWHILHSNSEISKLRTNAVLRDTNAWYHLVFQYDSTQATAANRTKMYINGVEVTSYATQTNSGQNSNYHMNTAVEHIIGAEKGNTGGSVGNYFNGTMSHVHFVDGTIYAPSTFGETDSTTGEWKIKTNPTISDYGNNGFFILKDGNSVTDQSPNTNNWTANGNLTKSEDCPSNVFATFNPLIKTPSGLSFSNGNTTLTTTNSQWEGCATTLAPSSGKWYWEAKYNTGSGIRLDIARLPTDLRFFENSNQSYLTYAPYGYGYQLNNSGYDYYGNNNSMTTWTTNRGNSTKIYMVAVDLDNGKWWIGADGNWFNKSGTANPVTGADPLHDFSANLNGDVWLFGMSVEGSGGSHNANFGNGYFGTTAVSSAGTNASGIGIFEYDVPTGYTALSTKGLNE